MFFKSPYQRSNTACTLTCLCAILLEIQLYIKDKTGSGGSWASTTSTTPLCSVPKDAGQGHLPPASVDHTHRLHVWHRISTHLCIIFLMLLVSLVPVPLSVHEKQEAFCWGLSYYACCAHGPTGYLCLTHVVCIAASPWWWCLLVLGLFLLGSIPKHGEGWFPASPGHLYIKHCCVVKHSHFWMVQSNTRVIKKRPRASKLKTSPVQQHCLLPSLGF